MALNITHTFTPATAILSSQMNTNFTDIETWANGNIGADSFATLTSQVTWSVSGSNKAISVTSTGTGVPLELISTTRGMLPPRMTTTQRNAIVSPVEGETLYNTTTDRVEFYTGTSWSSASPSYSVTGQLDQTEAGGIFSDVTGSTLNLTGKLIRFQFENTGAPPSGSEGFFTAIGAGEIRVLRDSTTIAHWYIHSDNTFNIPPGAMSFTHVPPSETTQYAYKVQIKGSDIATGIYQCKFSALVF